MQREWKGQGRLQRYLTESRDAQPRGSHWGTWTLDCAREMRHGQVRVVEVGQEEGDADDSGELVVQAEGACVRGQRLLVLPYP